MEISNKEECTAKNTQELGKDEVATPELAEDKFETFELPKDKERVRELSEDMEPIHDSTQDKNSNKEHFKEGKERMDELAPGKELTQELPKVQEHIAPREDIERTEELAEDTDDIEELVEDKEQTKPRKEDTEVQPNKSRIDGYQQEPLTPKQTNIRDRHPVYLSDLRKDGTDKVGPMQRGATRRPLLELTKPAGKMFNLSELRTSGVQVTERNDVTKPTPARGRISIMVKQLHKSKRSEFAIFTTLINYIVTQENQGRPFNDDAVSALGDVLYVKMSVDELLQVLETDHLKLEPCRELVERVLKVLYDKQYDLSTEDVGMTRCLAVIGGRDRSRASLPSIIASQLETDGHLGPFRRLGKLPTKSKTFASKCVAYMGFIFLFGGKQRTTFRVQTLSDCRMYTPVSDTWHELPAMATARVSFTAHVLPSRRHIMVVGGCQQWLYYDTCERFDLVKKTWTPASAMMTSRYSHAAAICGDLLYVTGGVVDRSTTNTVCVYNEVTDSWVTGPAMLRARADHSAGALSGKVVVCGGTDTVQDENKVYVTHNVFPVEILDVTKQQWSELSVLPFGHFSAQPVIADNCIFMVGGARIDDNLRSFPICNVTRVDMATGEATVEDSELPVSAEETAVCCIELPETLMDY